MNFPRSRSSAVPFAFAVLAACSSNSSPSNTPDGGSNSNSPDAAVVPDAPPPPPAMVQVTVTSAGAPASGVVVYFQNVDSTVVAEATTSASGIASAVMAAGGFVTALVPVVGEVGGDGGPVIAVRTIAGVKPGDQLAIVAPIANGTHAISFTAPLDNGMTSDGYALFTTCDAAGKDGVDPGLALTAGNGADSATGTMKLPNTCKTADAAVWATAIVGTQNNLSVASVIGATISKDTTLALGAYAAPTSVALTYSDVPKAVGKLTSSQALATANGLLAAPSAQLTVTGGAASGTLLQAPLTATTAVTFTDAAFTGDANVGAQRVIAAAAPGATYALDVGATALHEFTTAPVYTQATATVAWTVGTDGAAADLDVIDLGVTRGSAAWSWTIATADTGGSVVFPTLPADVYDYNPGATDPVTFSAFDALKVPGGYDAIRASVFSNLDPGAIVGTAGTVVDESLRPDLLQGN